MKPERYKILLVEDNAADRYLYRRSLSSAPDVAFETAEAETATAAIGLVRTYRPDCMILDFNLPDMDGLAFLAALKRELGAPPCPIVMLTGVHDERVAVSALKAGITDYIPKTDNIGDVLCRDVLSAIEKYRMAREIEDQRAALEASARQYRALIEAMPLLVWLADDNGAVKYANKRYAECLGLAPPASHPPRFEDAIVSEDHARYSAAAEEALAARKSLEMEVRIRRVSDGARRWHFIRIVPTHEDLGGARWVGAAMDIDDHKQAERTIQQTQKWESIGLLAGGIAHDFNNLLVGILGGASYASEGLPSAHPLQPTLKNIAIAGERAAQLTRQLLAYSGKGQFVMEPVNLAEIVDETCSLIRSSVPHGVHVDVRADRDLPIVQADPTQLQQVVMNLLLNATEAIPENAPGIIRIRTFSRPDHTIPNDPCVPAPNALNAGGYVVLEVQDSGCGMDEQTKSKIFDPFFTTKFTGRGLGLAAVQGIVRAVKGSIVVESQPGKGSTFRIFLPASAPSVHSRPAGVIAQPAPVEGSGHLILVIDDEEVVRTLARVSLERAGYRVLTATDGEAGLRCLDENRDAVSLVLLDMGMPEMSGKEVLTRLRQTGNRVPVAVCSGYNELDILRQVDGLDVAGFVAKPFRSHQLPERVHRLLHSLPGARDLAGSTASKPESGKG